MASCSTQQISSTSLKSFPVVVSKKLLSLIQTVKKVNMITTFGEVLDGLRVYISDRRLYDPVDPTKIYCCDDELSSVLGTAEFTIYDVRKLLQKLVVPVILNKNNSVEVMKTVPASIGENAGKRKAEVNFLESFEEGGTIKKTCEQQSNEPMVLYIPPSPAREEESSESYESIHGYETSFVKDTSDDSFSYFDDSDHDLLPGDILAVEETFDVEYEVESDTDDETNVYISESGSESEDAVNTVITFVCNPDSDQEFWADKSSDEEFDSDLEIPESDKWNCKKCGSFNNPPMRYCIKCWSMRSGWVAPKRSEQRPHPRRKPRSKKNKNGDKPVDIIRKEPTSSPKPATSSSSSSAPEMSSASISSTNESLKIANAYQEQLPSVSSDICSSTDLPDLQSPSSNSLQEFPFTSLAPNYPQKYFSNLSTDLSSSSQELSTLSSNSSSQEFPSTCNSSQEFPSNSLDVPSTSKEVINSLSNFGTLNLSTVPKCDADSKLCLLCCSKPANASIIHGKYAHQISCYRCAKKLQHENKRCPVCRRTIDRVVYQITAL